MASLQCNLGDILKERGINALEFSRLINYRKSTIYELINHDMEHKRIPTPLMAVICDYLDITLDQLFTVIKEK